MLLIHLISVLVLLVNLICSQTLESTNFVFDSPDLTILIESNQNQFQIEAFKSSLNDKLIKENQTGFEQQLKWTSLGNPLFVKTIQNNVSRLFHDSSDGFYAFIQRLSNHEREMLAKEAKDSYGLIISKNQIVMLPLITFTCKIALSNNKVFIGKVKSFNRNPLRLDFIAPKDSKERLLLNSGNNELNIDCSVQAKAKSFKTIELSINAQEMENLQFKEKLFGKANEVYLTPNHLDKFASELYSTLNINEDYEMTEFQFSKLFVEEIIKKFTNTGFTHVPFDEVIPLLPKYSEELRPIFEQIIEIKRDEEQDEYLALNTEKLEELKSLIDIEDFSLQTTVSFLNSNKRDLKSLLGQLNDLNRETKNEIKWKRDGLKILPKSLFVAKFEVFSIQYGSTVQFNKIKKVAIESEFEKHFRLYSISDIAQSNSDYEEPKLSEEIAKCQNESKYEMTAFQSKYDQMLNEKNFEIENCKKELNSNKCRIILAIKTFTGHTGFVESLVVLHDGSLASSSVDSTIRIWDLNTDSTRISLIGHTSSVWSLAVLPDGSLASGSYDKTIRIWDVTSGETIKALTGHTDSVLSLAVLQDGSLASGSKDNTIKIWNLNSCPKSKTLIGHTHYVRSLAVLQDGSLASGSADNTIRIWDLNSGLTIRTLIGHTLPVYSLAVLQDGSLASGSNDTTIIIWDVKNGSAIRTLTGHTGSVLSLAVLQDGTLASGSADSTIKLWNLNGCPKSKTLIGHTHYVRSLAVLQDGLLASGSYDNTIRIWNKSQEFLSL